MLKDPAGRLSATLVLLRRPPALPISPYKPRLQYSILDTNIPVRDGVSCRGLTPQCRRYGTGRPSRDSDRMSQLHGRPILAFERYCLMMRHIECDFPHASMYGVLSSGGWWCLLALHNHGIALFAISRGLSPAYHASQRASQCLYALLQLHDIFFLLVDSAVYIR
jgi:hypothetical protein